MFCYNGTLEDNRVEYSRILNMPPKEAINSIKSQCNCNITLFRMVEMSFLPPKDFGIFCVSNKNCLFFSFNGKKTFGFNAPKRHFKIKLSHNNSQTLLYGRFCFSDFFSYLFVAVVFSFLVGTKTHFEKPQYMLLFVVGFVGVWAIQSFIGIFAFRKEEKMLVEKIDDLLEAITQGDG